MELMPLSSKVIHIWNWSQRWNGTSKGTTEIWIWIIPSRVSLVQNMLVERKTSFHS